MAKDNLFIKFTAFWVLFMITLGSLDTAECRAYERIDTVRVGLESRISGGSVSFSDRQLVAGFEENGQFYPMLGLSSSSSFSAAPSNSYFAAAAAFYYDQPQASSAVNSYISQGLSASVCLTGPMIYTVYAGPYSSSGEAQAAANMMGGTVVSSDRLVLLMDGGNVAAVFDNPRAYPQFYCADGFTSLSGRRYRGRIECARFSKTGLNIINVIGLEEYLYSTVPSEMPSAWNAEALKAQAVAARSYTYTRIGVHASSGYDLCDGTHCQSYLGASNEAASTTSAVDATRGLLAFYNGEPINAVFFASSGGHTEDSEKVWTQAIPYLRGVADSYETTGKTWTRTITLSDLDSVISAKGLNLGRAAGISIAEVTSYGRVQKLVINGSNGSFTVQKEDIRNFFSSLPDGALESRMFSIANGIGSVSSSIFRVTNQFYSLDASLPGLKVMDSEGRTTVIGSGSSLSVASSSGISEIMTSDAASQSSGDVIVISGRGHGHGVGMSQHGANGMAAQGFGFDEILQYYYYGIELR